MGIDARLDNLIAWSLYLIAATLLYACLMPVFRRIQRKPVQRALRILYVWLFYTPALSAAKGLSLAPAFMVLGYSAVLHDESMMLQAALFYLASAALWLCVYVVDRAIYTFLHPASGQKPPRSQRVTPRI